MSTAIRDPFAVLGLPRRFELSPEEIRRAYLSKVVAAHPDVSSPDPLAGDSAEALDAGMLNRARAMLDDPETRAGCLLTLLGGPAADRDKSLPEGFLPRIMQTREEIEEALAEGGEAAARWKAWGEAEHRETIARVGELFARAAGDSQVLVQIRVELNAWRYLTRLRERLDPSVAPADPLA